MKDLMGLALMSLGILVPLGILVVGIVATIAGGGSVTVSGYYNAAANKVERIAFSDRAVLDSVALDANTLQRRERISLYDTKNIHAEWSKQCA